MSMSFGYGPAADKQEMISLIRKAVERGVTFCSSVSKAGAHRIDKVNDQRNRRILRAKEVDRS